MAKKQAAGRPRKMKSYASFEEWRQDQSEESRKLIDSLSRLVEKAAPEFEPSVKWGQGCWIFEGTPRVYIHAASDHVQLGFYAGSSLNDPESLLRGKGKYVRHVRITSTRELPQAALAELIDQVR